MSSLLIARDAQHGDCAAVKLRQAAAGCLAGIGGNGRQHGGGNVEKVEKIIVPA